MTDAPSLQNDFDHADMLRSGFAGHKINTKTYGAYTLLFAATRGMTELFEDHAKNKAAYDFAQTGTCWAASATLAITLLSAAGALYFRSRIRKLNANDPSPPSGP